MKIGKVLQELWQMPTNALVGCETGDFGPCVDYAMASHVGKDEDGWRPDCVWIDGHGEDGGPILTVLDVIAKLQNFSMGDEVVISDGFEAKPFLINSKEELLAHCSKAGGRADFYTGEFPIVIFDC